MHPLQRLSTAEQTAARLRADLRAGRWRGNLPGVVKLAAELDVSPPTLRTALRLLENEGLLGTRGLGRSRVVTTGGTARRSLRVGMVTHDPLWTDLSPTLQVMLQIQQGLEAAGNVVFWTEKSQFELRHDVSRIARQVTENPADAWIVVSGSRGLLEWFAEQPFPAIALYGRSGGLPLARTGPDKLDAYLEVTRRLIALGHRRIVNISPSPRRKPVPGTIERAFLRELEAHGIATGDYNLPDWEETPEGFHALLDSLFRTTPPTALIIEETPRVIATMQFLALRHVEVPKQVSLVSTDYDSSLAWCHPPVTHMRWDSRRVVRRVLRWVDSVRKGRIDRRTINFPTKLVLGGSIGPAPKA